MSGDNCCLTTDQVNWQQSHIDKYRTKQVSHLYRVELMKSKRETNERIEWHQNFQRDKVAHEKQVASNCTLRLYRELQQVPLSTNHK